MADPTFRDPLEGVRATARTILTEPEAKRLLAALGISVPRGGVARTAEEAEAVARELGVVVLKVVAPGVTHKSRLGWVACPIPPGCVRECFRYLMDRAVQAGSPVQGVLVEQYLPGDVECIVGYARLPRFGPVIMFGLGGLTVEARGEVRFRLAPLGPAEADTLVSEVGDGSRGWVRALSPKGRDALIHTLVTVGGIAADPRLSAIREVDINPLAVSRDGCAALDALVILEPPEA